MKLNKYAIVVAAIKELGLRSSLPALIALVNDKLESQAMREVEVFETKLLFAGKISVAESKRFWRIINKATGWNQIYVQLSRIFNNFEVGLQLACMAWQVIGYEQTVSYEYVAVIRKKIQKQSGIIFDCRSHADVPGRNMIERIAA